MATDRNVRIVVEAITKGQDKLAGLSKSLDGIGTQARKLGDAFKEGFGGQVSSQLGGIGDAINALPGPLGIVAGAASLAGAALFKMALDTTAAAIEFDKLSQKTGASVEFLSGMSAAVRDADIDVATLNQGLVKFADNLSRTVGPTANVQNELFKLADRFAQMPDGASKTALAIDAFGRSGAELIPILNGGSDSLRTMLADLQATGRVMSTETVEAAKRLDDQIDKLNGRIEGLKLGLSSGVVPALLGVFDASDKLAAEFDLVAISAEHKILALQRLIEGANMSSEALDRLIKYERVLSVAQTEGAVAAQRLYVELFNIPTAANAAGSAVGKSAVQAQKSAVQWIDAAGKIRNAGLIIAGAGGRGTSPLAAYEAGRRAQGEAARQTEASRRMRDAYIAENRAASANMTTQQRAAAAAAARSAGYRALYDQIQANVSANDRYGRSWADLTAKISGGGGAVQQIDEQLKALEDRARAIGSALSVQNGPLSKNEKLQTAYAIATGELSAEQFQLQQAIKAVVSANEAGALSTEQALAAALSAGQGLAGVQELYALAGDAGKTFAADAAEIAGAVTTATAKVEDIRTRIGKLPDSKTIELAAKIIGGDNVDKLRQQMEFLLANAKTAIVIDVIYRQTGAPPPPPEPPGRALGGPAFGWTWVGERGPELVYFGSPGRVFSNTQSKQIASGDAPTGDVNITFGDVTIASDMDARAFAWRVADEIQRRRR